ncbi:unnamed protein product [Ostreobium quekettii]|uniref:Proteasome assembly chaperone 3 n=1 Tax=Ostreobium quekettii TaxID=121088 RepID=A0A8S1J1M3_9CHLO|nr:unnamed protein product [Ostreobium quekettii]|eukprot:evm.model.scf_270.1 EVM.evm.TU.scf_270.1   scf_270:9522-12729(+)
MAQFCVPTRRFLRDIEGVSTDFVLSAYDDRVVVVATQIGTVGTVLQASPETALDGSVTFGVSVLLGRRDQEELLLCARRIVDGASKTGCRRPLIICLGLKSPTMATVKGIIETILEDPIW